MMTADILINDLIADFKARQWKSEPMEKALHLAATAPERLADFAAAVMNELPKGGTFFDAALMFLPEQAWPELVRSALTHFQANPQNEAAESVLQNALLQCVQALHPWLSELFVTDAWFQSYNSVYAWRESGTCHLSFLADQLKSKNSHASAEGARYRGEYQDLRIRAFSALLETRDPDALALACAAAPELGCSSEQLQWKLWAVDREITNGVMRSLVPAKVRHFQFESGYIEHPDFLAKWSLPTWDAPGSEEPLYRFGGYADSSCGICGERLHHVVTLSPVPDNLGVTGTESLSLAVCLSCMGWEEHILFFQHDPDGAPAAFHVLAEKRVPQFPSPALQETKVALTATPSRWRWQDWGSSNGRENLHRLGGHPYWVQSAEYPLCPQCQQTMPFLMQLDSELRLEDRRSLLWGSGGIAYFFWCDTCRISAASWQCT